MPGPAASPYLSVVVTSRNDDHGGDPLKRLQAFINCFEAQCSRYHLDAEVIVVEWNPPDAKPRLHTLLRWPGRPVCTYRFVEVPPELHATITYSDVLPLYQMIAKNVGIRRARGRFVLATNIDIIFSEELIAYLASGQLTEERLYRVDRHDIESAFPVDAPLADQMTYCSTHQLRVHASTGSYAVDRFGEIATLSEDIVDGVDLKLGAGWHVLEGARSSGFYRWATDRARIWVSPVQVPSVLEIDVEPNPYDRDAVLDVEVAGASEHPQILKAARRTLVRAKLEPSAEPRIVEFRWVRPPSDSLSPLAIFERRQSMYYVVHSINIASGFLEAELHTYPPTRWKADSTATLFPTTKPGAVSVTSDSRQWSYAVEYGPLRPNEAGVYRFEVAFDLYDGDITLGVLSGNRKTWLDARVDRLETAEGGLFNVLVTLEENESFWLVISNNHPAGAGASRFLLKRLSGTADYSLLAVPVATVPGGGSSAAARRGDMPAVPVRSKLKGIARSGTRLLRRTAVSLMRTQASTVAEDAESSSRRAARNPVGTAAIPTVQHPEERHQVARRQAADPSREPHNLLSTLGELSHVYKVLQEHRPVPVHQNGCGDFQLMARPHWHDLRGYPEFQTFSMNIDGLFSTAAHYAGVREHVLESPMHIYHLEHEIGSGWTPEGEALLRKRIAERGITWLDSRDVFLFGAYMDFLGRPMIFNPSNWGFGDVPLEEVVIAGHPSIG